MVHSALLLPVAFSAASLAAFCRNWIFLRGHLSFEQIPSTSSAPQAEQ